VVRQQKRLRTPALDHQGRQSVCQYEDSNLHTHRRENLKSYLYVSSWQNNEQTHAWVTSWFSRIEICLLDPLKVVSFTSDKLQLLHTLRFPGKSSVCL
jgi:hypothetical protein